MLIAGLVVLLLALIVVVYWGPGGKSRALPPGPWGLPVLGYLPFLGRSPLAAFNKLFHRYGDVVGLQMGSRYVVLLGSYKVVREAFKMRETLERPPSSTFEIRDTGTSFVIVNGEEWSEQRKFFLNTLRVLGMGQSRLLDNLKAEVRLLLEEVESTGSAPIDARPLLTASMSNNIFTLVFGRRLRRGDPLGPFLSEMLAVVTAFFLQTAAHAFLPALKRLYTVLGIFRRHPVNKYIDRMEDFVKKEIQSHEDSRVPGSPRDYIDAYLDVMDSHEAKSFTTRMLLGNIQALFAAGSDTVRVSVQWALVAMAASPASQARLHAEIDAELGGAEPEWEDRSRLPYVGAVLAEAQRWRTVVPVNIQRYTSEEIHVAGHCIPAGTIIFSVIQRIHMDPAYWENAEDFNPDRFLEPGGASIKKHDAYMPFSWGELNR
ncbi:Cyp18a1 [Cordylochernes scorpioides]|uniref:Cyp18a1 n=1 Tax=Cordylochernes scorpioides TaxID=51811 RepID=A0ABY6LS14_9ARAC|nr:Cyp18a1 [Cordylochernes scorpioides]